MGLKVKFSPWLVGTLALVGVSLFFAALLTRQLTASRPLPAPPAPRATQAVPGQETNSAASDDNLAAYNVIVTKHLFNPSRSEGTPPATTTVAAALPPKPVLHGLVVDGTSSVAFLEDPGSKRTLAYRVGDNVAGGQLVQIGSDRVMIRRTDGQIDVLLNDPTKVKAVPEATQQPGARGRGAAAAQQPGVRNQTPVRTPRAAQPADQPPAEQPQPQVAPPPQDSDD